VDAARNNAANIFMILHLLDGFVFYILQNDHQRKSDNQNEEMPVGAAVESMGGASRDKYPFC
jgi:hypothetical protein